ncbi:FadR/GntR family transcriptional regulator [Amaricoccus sp.]|uniref:FadR/GntR family transcriptional regulator n=1 Tax=Amaricoccus sp. TaxID=1872485 RepID=UPI00263588BD|nr:FadR/GntR family transcriptional regulator [Amaricoccus sp.]HRO11960.1 FadR/GntR family transcriptional regulator [Amaricoccus sp.]
MARDALASLAALPPLGRADQVAEALSRHIDEAHLKPGDRLPTERALMQALGIGRSSLREAVSQLRALGVLETRIGSGIYIRKPVSARTVHLPLSIEPRDLAGGLLLTLEVRRGVEIEASMAAARRRTPEDIARIETALDEMERVHLREGTSGAADLAFHLTVYDASGNPLFRQVLEQLRGHFERFWAQPFDRPDFAGRSFPFHRRLFEAIRDGDPKAAAAHTRAILDIVEEDIREMSR